MLLVVALVAGCSEEKKPPTPATAPQVQPLDGPLPIRFGTCAHAGYRFVSGPYPRTLLHTDPPPAPIPPPPPFMTMQVTKPMPSFGAPRLDPARTAGFVGPDTSHDTGSTLGSGSDLLGAGSAQTRGLGIRGEGQQNTGPTYGGGIGNLSPSGYGYGTGPRRTVQSPISLGTPTVKPLDVLDVAIVRRYIKRHIQSISLCYVRMQNENEKLAGDVTASFVIGSDGFVSTSSATGLAPEVAKCIALTIKNIQFPKPKNAGTEKPAIAHVEYPITFKPSSDGSYRLAEYQASYNEATERARTALYAPDPRDRSGATTASPLTSIRTAIEACLRAGTVRAGALVIDLTFDANKTLTTSAVHGSNDESVKSCLVKALTPLHGDEGSQRCSLAFGELPVAQMPAIELTAGGVAMAGKTLTDIKTIEETSKPNPAIARAITERVAATVASPAVVTIHGPLVVKPEPSTSMRVVKRVLSSITAGGDDFVLAIKKADGWAIVKPPPNAKIVTPLVLPVAPVPIGVGTVWNPLRVSGSTIDHALSVWVRVEKDRVELRSDEPMQTVAMGDVLVRLEQILETINRNVILSAADDVPYEQFMRIVEIVQRAGFSAWQLAAE